MIAIMKTLLQLNAETRLLKTTYDLIMFSLTLSQCKMISFFVLFVETGILWLQKTEVTGLQH